MEDHRIPYVQEIIALTIDKDAMMGVLHFDGYYYVDDTELPRKARLVYTRPEAEPYEVEGGCMKYRYADIFDAEVEITKREKIENTNTYSPVEDDGEEMNICFFPTDIQKIYFTILAINHEKRP
jgi:hypothetical protein